MWIDFGGGYFDTNRLALALGKTVVLAANFESNCKFVATSRFLDTRRSEEFPGIFGAMQFEELEKYFASFRPLGREITKIQSAAPEQIQALKKGVHARNHIAHEAGLAVVRTYEFENRREFRREINRLVTCAEDIAEADNIVARWSCSIVMSRDPAAVIKAPNNYVRRCVTWVAQGLNDPLLFGAPTQRP